MYENYANYKIVKYVKCLYFNKILFTFLNKFLFYVCFISPLLYIYNIMLILYLSHNFSTVVDSRCIVLDINPHSIKTFFEYGKNILKKIIWLSKYFKKLLK